MRKPTANMDAIIKVLAAGPMTWEQIQFAIGGLHGAVLIGILNRMIQRGLVTKDGEYYRLTPQ
jgi:predicted transcriptional regulator